MSLKGEPHKGISVGKGKTALVLGPGRFGFKCFSSDCGHHTMGELRRPLFDKIGRWRDVYAAATTWTRTERTDGSRSITDQVDPGHRRVSHL